MNIIITLTYFHPIIGPIVFYSFPKEALEEDLKAQITNFMDQQLKEGFFRHSFENFYSLNYYSSIYSDWGRGNKELLMFSIILEQQTTEVNEKIIENLLIEFSETFQSNQEIFMGFYINDIDRHVEQVELIMKNNGLIKSGVKNLYGAVTEKTQEKTEEEKMAYLINNEHIYKTLEKLSESPVELEQLREWVIEHFPNEVFEEIIDPLVEKQIIIINQIGLVEKYVILLKEVKVERIPPDSVIEYIDDKPELMDSWLPKVQKYFSEYEKKDEEELKKDSYRLFQIMADSKKYNILSELRNGLISRKELPNLVTKRSLDSLLGNIEYLKDYDIIEELIYNNERYVVLKTDLRITTAFPEWMKKLLPKS